MTKVLESASSWELTFSVSPIHHESSLHTLRNAHFRREEVLHDEGQLAAIISQEVFSGFPDRSCAAAPLFHS